MRKCLIESYEAIFEKYHLERPIDGKKINEVIKKSLKEFLVNANHPAIYCSGGHTKMLMADFMFELKKVKHIVDNYAKIEDDAGFKYITDGDIETEKIDAIVISTFKFRNDVVRKLSEEHRDIPFLNLYDKLEENGIHLEADYYYSNHPFQHYHTINTLKRQLTETKELGDKVVIYRQLVTKFLHIKDFVNAAYYTREWNKLDEKNKLEALIKDIDTLYQLELKAVENISVDNVLMLCIDGLRRCDLYEGGMPLLNDELKKTSMLYKNAYSFSTSTFESLIPVYSENGNLQTGYFNQNSIDEADCRFICEAKKQGRNIFFYADMEHYVESDEIYYSETFQSATEKLWNFIIDAVEEKNGLFYIHILYESHYSFSNPYTTDKLLSEGTAMLFDYLPAKGGKLRADYVQQHNDALRYLDEVLTPFVKRLPCAMMLYADHGNLILEKDTKEEDIPETKLTFDEEWIQIPIVLKAPFMSVGEENKLVSLMSLNEMVISLMKHREYKVDDVEYIKVARSELYNPDFRYLYKKWGKETDLLAFEEFIFLDNKLAIFADGRVELYDKNDGQKNDKEREIDLLGKVVEEITVCKREDIVNEKSVFHN